MYYLLHLFLLVMFICLFNVSMAMSAFIPQGSIQAWAEDWVGGGVRISQYFDSTNLISKSIYMGGQTSSGAAKVHTWIQGGNIPNIGIEVRTNGYVKDGWNLLSADARDSVTYIYAFEYVSAGPLPPNIVVPICFSFDMEASFSGSPSHLAEYIGSLEVDKYSNTGDSYYLAAGFHGVVQDGTISRESGNFIRWGPLPSQTKPYTSGRQSISLKIHPDEVVMIGLHLWVTSHSYAYTVQGTGTTSLGSNYTYATIDPTVTVDPLFLQQYPGSLAFYTVPPSVPVPSTVLLLGSGLLSLMGWRRFRKS